MPHNNFVNKFNSGKETVVLNGYVICLNYRYVSIDVKTITTSQRFISLHLPDDEQWDGNVGLMRHKLCRYILP